jgi:hypothetical protein
VPRLGQDEVRAIRTPRPERGPTGVVLSGASAEDNVRQTKLNFRRIGLLERVSTRRLVIPALVI